MQHVYCSVSVDLYENIVSMGFNRRSAANALKLCDNDLNLALQVRHVFGCIDCSFHWLNFQKLMFES